MFSTSTTQDSGMGTEGSLSVQLGFIHCHRHIDSDPSGTRCPNCVLSSSDDSSVPVSTLFDSLHFSSCSEKYKAHGSGISISASGSAPALAACSRVSVSDLRCLYGTEACFFPPFSG